MAIINNEVLPESTRIEIITSFIDNLTPCEKRVWDRWYPTADVSQIMQLRMQRGRHFPIIQGGRKITPPQKPFSYSPAPGGNAA